MRLIHAMLDSAIFDSVVDLLSYFISSVGTEFCHITRVVTLKPGLITFMTVDVYNDQSSRVTTLLD